MSTALQGDDDASQALADLHRAVRHSPPSALNGGGGSPRRPEPDKASSLRDVATNSSDARVDEDLAPGRSERDDAAIGALKSMAQASAS